MISRLKFLEKVQWWDWEQIRNYQNNLLTRLINISYHEVKFYKELMDNNGVESQSINSALDLNKLSIVTKDMLRRGYPDRITRKTGQKTYEASTSGSTGKNFYVLEDAYTAGWYRATFLLELEWAGWSIGDPHLQTGMTINRSRDRRLKDWFLNCHYYPAYQLDDFHLDDILNTIDKNKLKFVFGYPGSLYQIAKYAKVIGWNKQLKSAVTWGDMLYPHQRNTIEAAFQTKVFDTYGCGEGIQIAAQCDRGNYHIFALDVIVEILDDDAKPVNPGEEGNIVVTRLHPGPMPLIRYAIGDRGVLADVNEMCQCGRGFPLLKSIAGRSADVIVTPSGNRLIVHFFTGVLEHFKAIDSFQVVQDAKDSIILRILPNVILTTEIELQIIAALQEKGCSDLSIHIEYVDEMPLPPSGKHRFIVSNLK